MSSAVFYHALIFWIVCLATDVYSTTAHG